MKWLVSLAIMGVLTLLLLDAGLFERERFGIATQISRIPFIDHAFPFVGSLHMGELTPIERIVLSTVTIIVGLYLFIRLILLVLPARWFALDNGQVGRLPDPRLLRDRVREQESNRKIKKLLHVSNGLWMVPLGTITIFFLIVSLPVVLLDRTYDWAWGLSLLVPITLYCCAARPDRARELVLTIPELRRLLTPQYFREMHRRGWLRRHWDRLRARDRLLGMRIRAWWRRRIYALLRRPAPPPTGLYLRARTVDPVAASGAMPGAHAFSGSDPIASVAPPPATPPAAEPAPRATPSPPTTPPNPGPPGSRLTQPFRAIGSRISGVRGSASRRFSRSRGR